MFTRSKLAAEERRALLAGRSGAECCDDGPIVCACHRVGQTKIRRAICERQLTDLRGIGDGARRRNRLRLLHSRTARAPRGSAVIACVRPPEADGSLFPGTLPK